MRDSSVWIWIEADALTINCLHPHLCQQFFNGNSVGVGAVDLGGIKAVAAAEQPIGKAISGKKRVVAVFAEEGIRAGGAGEDVVACTAVEDVVAAAADEGVVAGVAVEGVVGVAAGDVVGGV